MQAERREWDNWVTEIMRWHRLLIGLATLIVLLLAYAWYDGGREPLRPIAEPVLLPEDAA